MVMQKGEIINVPYGHSFPDYLDYRKSVSTLTNLVAFMPTPVHLSARGQTPERTWVEVVSPNYFALGGVTPAFGELLKPGEGESKGRHPRSCSLTATGSAGSAATRRLSDSRSP